MRNVPASGTYLSTVHFSNKWPTCYSEDILLLRKITAEVAETNEVIFSIIVDLFSHLIWDRSVDTLAFEA